MMLSNVTMFGACLYARNRGVFAKIVVTLLCLAASSLLRASFGIDDKFVTLTGSNLGHAELNLIDIGSSRELKYHFSVL